MPIRLRGELARRLGVSVLAAAAVATMASAPAQAQPTSAHNASAVQNVEGPQRDGSGTVSDPWVPMRSAHVTCQTATLFGNYSNHHHSDPIATLTVGTWIGVRYVTSDNYSADVLWHYHGQWGFMLRSCFAFG